MKRNKTIIRILLLVVIMLFFVLINKSFGETVTFYGPFNAAYNMSGQWTAYCREHGKALGGTIGGLKIEQLQYTRTSNSTKIEPATGYALTCGESGATLQHVIWYSKLWTGGTNAVVEGSSKTAGIQQRYKAYGDVYYGIIKPYEDMKDKASNKEEVNLFTVTTDVTDKSIKLMVNQQAKKYIVGPYKIKLNPNIKYTVKLENVQNPIINEQNSLAQTLGSQKKQSYNNIAPKEYSNKITYGDITVYTKNKYYDGETVKVPTSLSINGHSVKDTEDNCFICREAKEYYESTLDDYNSIRDDINTYDGDKTSDEYKELLAERDEAKKVYNRARKAYNKIKSMNHIAFVVMHALQNYANYDSNMTDTGDIYFELREYYSILGIDLDGKDSEFDFSNGQANSDEEGADAIEDLAQNAVDIIGDYSSKITASLDDNSIIIENKENIEQISENAIDDVGGSAVELMNNDEDEDYTDAASDVFNNGSVFTVSTEAKQELYDELINWKNESNPFAKFNLYDTQTGTSDLSGINGDPKSFRLLDAGGNEIQFPDFVGETPFYIEFTPNNDGDIEYVGSPTFNIHWLKDFNYTVDGSFAESKELSIKGIPTEYEVISNSLIGSSRNQTGIFHKKQYIRLPVKVGKSQTLIGYSYGYLYYETDVNREHWTHGTKDNPPEFIDYHLATSVGSDDDWSLEVAKSVKNWEFSGVPGAIQKIDGKIQSVGNATASGYAVWDDEVVSRLTNKAANNVEIGGTVWLDSPEVKTGNTNGTYDSGDQPFAGIQVQLYDVTNGNTAVVSGSNGSAPGTLVAVTTTDKNGKYRFYGTSNIKSGTYTYITKDNKVMHDVEMDKLIINPLHKYYVAFVYNGQMYQAVTMSKDITATGGKSNAKDVSRQTFNAKFTTIASDPDNYKGQSSLNRAYGISHKIEDSEGNYIQYKSTSAMESDSGSNSQALTYGDVWNKFVELATNPATNILDTKANAETNETNSFYISYKDGSVKWGNNKEVISWKRWNSNSTDANVYAQGDKGGNYGNKTIAVDNRASGTGTTNYSDALIKLKAWLKGLNVGSADQKGIEQFIKDSMMVASTLQNNQTYPFDTNKFENYTIADIENPQDSEVDLINEFPGNSEQGKYPYLYQAGSSSDTPSNIYGNQSRYVDYGVNRREVADLALAKDAYKVVLQVNGKEETYYYNKKDLDNNDGSWKIANRKGDGLFNGADYYKRQIRASEYLFDGSDSYGDHDNNIEDAKNLRAWVTYKIAIKNQGMLNIDLDGTEVVDYYDATQYKYAPEKIAPYVGKTTDDKNQDNSDLTLTVSTDSKYRNAEGVSGYNNLYITGIKNSGKKYGKNILNPGDICYMYITFEVNKPNSKIIIDQDLSSGAETVGKKNIAEINAYTTRYTGSQKVPNAGNVGQSIAGIIDTDSNPGSLRDNDLDGDGNIRHSNNDWENRQEDDTDKAPNMKFIIENNNIRKFSGTVFEDERNVNSNSSKVGNGTYDSGENTINGVTVQLVELVQNVNSDGTTTGTYKGEKVWATYNYGSTTNFSNLTTDYKRYYSGEGNSKVIISGPQNSVLYVGQENNLSSGQYEFNSIPAGDFFVRFIYGDTTQTTLTRGDNDVNSLVGTSVDGLSGLNSKSYNGQDYKSTVYQAGLNSNGQVVTQVNQTGEHISGGNYNGIYGYTNYETQNGEKTDDIDSVQYKDNKYQVVPDVNDDTTKDRKISETSNAANKSTKYYYNISAANDVSQRVSDAKDVYDYRQIVNNYSSSNVEDGNGNLVNASGVGVKNNKAEILRSFDTLATDIKSREVTAKANNDAAYDNTFDKNEQAEMIRNFMNNTRMVAQTGIINIEVENSADNKADNTETTEVESNKNGGAENKGLVYVITDLDLGLVERPRAQLQLNKEVENFRVTLANGQILFDTDKSVKDLSFSKHIGHSVNGVNNQSLAIEKANKYNRLGGLRLENVAVSSNKKDTPELIQLYMDDELMEGATMNAIYRLTVTNVGEVDYLDKQFYYSGITAHPNDVAYISRTNATDVIDYVANNVIFDNTKGNQDQWAVTTAAEQTGSSMLFKNESDIPSETTNSHLPIVKVKNSYGTWIATVKPNVEEDYVNRAYLEELNTYNTLIHTTTYENGLRTNNSASTSNVSGQDIYAQGLLPEMIENDNRQTSISTTLELSCLLSSNTSGDNLIYNNLSEITATTNTQGRRMQFSTVGNQQMADQKLGQNAASTANSSDDLITPTEIDADSAQKIVIMPPTGANKNYIPFVAALAAAAAIIIVAAVLIRKYAKKEDK